MLKGIRRISHVAKAKIGSTSEDDMLKMDNVGLQIDRLKKALADHSRALAELARTSLVLNSALAQIYPTGGPLHESLSQLGARDVAFSTIRDTAGGVADSLADPLQQLDTLRHEIREDCVQRMHYGAEIEHYSEKLIKLRNGGEKEKTKLDENMTKLSSVTAQHTELHKSIQARLDRLEETMCALLDDPFVSLLNYHAEHYQACYDAYHQAHATSAASGGGVIGGVQRTASLKPAITAVGGDGPLPQTQSLSSFTGASVGGGNEQGATIVAREVTRVDDIFGASSGAPGSTRSLNAPFSGAPEALPPHGMQIVMAIADHTAASQTEIGFKKGDVFIMTNSETNGWAHGRIGDMFGDFPVSHVRASPRTSVKNSVRANFDYTEDDATELSFKAGDVLGILSDDNPGWWLASLKSRVGYIPSNYVTAL